MTRVNLAQPAQVDREGLMQIWPSRLPIKMYIRRGNAKARYRKVGPYQFARADASDWFCFLKLGPKPFYNSSWTRRKWRSLEESYAEWRK